MLDHLIKDGFVVDGTGRPGRHVDVGVRDGRVVSIGPTDERAGHVTDADGLVVAPGFVDLHTHYDAQAFWDPTLSPSPLHGVTTVFGGNCGFSIAPLEPGTTDYLLRMLARVEGMPVATLQQGVPWSWRSTAEYLDLLDGTLVPNAGFLVGHSALRCVVMGDDATERAATAEEIEQMCQLLRVGLTAGGCGFSSTTSRSHNDHRGVPVPSRHATHDELVALSAVVGELPGTTLEFIPMVGAFDEPAYELMTAMSLAAGRPLNWNVMAVYAGNVAQQDTQLAASDHAARRGAKVLALTLPDSLRNRLTFESGFILDQLPGWDAFFRLPGAGRLAVLADPTRRRALDDLAQTMPGKQRSIAHWARYRIEAASHDTARFDGRTVAEVAEELGLSPWDALCEVLLADELRTGLWEEDRGQDDATWARRVAMWRDARTVVGASDAGAHLDMIDSFSYATTLLARTVRQRGLLEVEEAVQLLSDAPARLYGLRRRGRIAEGWHADLVLFDLDRIDPGPVGFRHDLPGGSGRLYGEPEGMEVVMVNGTVVVSGGAFTEARPGTLLRSGRDTETVGLSA